MQWISFGIIYFHRILIIKQCNLILNTLQNSISLIVQFTIFYEFYFPTCIYTLQYFIHIYMLMLLYLQKTRRMMSLSISHQGHGLMNSTTEHITSIYLLKFSFVLCLLLLMREQKIFSIDYFPFDRMPKLLFLLLTHN